jgi:hypothetical protein
MTRIATPSDNAHPLILELYALIVQLETNPGALSGKAGLCPNAVWRILKCKRSTRIDMMDRVLAPLGYELVIRPKRGE